MDNKVRTSRVDWDHWLNIPTVTLWQAVALSMDIDPDDEQRINIREGGLNKLITSPDKDIKYRKRLKLLIAHVYDTNHLHVRNREKIKYANSVIYLNSFADFALIIDWDIPKELTLLRTPVGDKVLSNNRERSTEKKQEETEEEEEEAEETELDSIMNASDFDHITKQGIINFFDKVKEEEWDKLFKNAYRTGLKETKKEGSNKYNPFLVGTWLLNNNGKYTCPQIERKLANCLKPESKYKKDLITDLRTTDFE